MLVEDVLVALQRVLVGLRVPQQNIEPTLVDAGARYQATTLVDVIDLRPVDAALRAAGVDEANRIAAVTFLSHLAETGDCVAQLPPDAAGLDPMSRHELIEEILQRDPALRAHPPFRVSRVDHTPTANIKDAPLLQSSRSVPTLLVVAGRSVGRIRIVDRDRFIIGRAGDADLIVDDDGASRHHAAIVRRDGQLILTDLGSKNGVAVNGFGVSEYTLEDGDTINLGSTTVVKFAFRDELEEQVQRSLYHNATTDPLTGLYNRRFIVERLAAECAFARRQKIDVAVAMIDIDHFKRINDTFGHAAGDEVLVQISTQFRNAARGEDVVGRLGGEEFCAVLRGADVAGAVVFAERLRKSVASQHFTHTNMSIPVTISVGVAAASRDADPKHLLEEADRSLYQAKAAGRNRVCTPPG